MPHIRKRGNSYGATLQVDGERRHVSIHADELKKLALTPDEWADKELEAFEDERERVSLGLPGAMSLSALFDHFEAHHLPGLAPNTRKTYKASLKRFRQFFDGANDLPAGKVQTGHIMAFISWRRSEAGGAVSGRTIDKDRTVLHTVMAHGVELGVVDRNPVTKKTRPTYDSRAPYILDADEFEKLMKACSDPMLKVYVLTLYETGLRSESEALWLRWTDLEHDYQWKDQAGNVVGRGRVVVPSGKEHRTKGGKSRVVPMTPRLRQALMKHRLAFAGKLYNGERSPWVFHHVYNRRRAKAGERIGSLRRGFDAALERAEGFDADRIHQHDLRHTRCTRWLAEGKPAHVVAAGHGHAQIRTTMGYYQYTDEHLRALVEQDVDAAEMAALGS